MKLSTFNTLTLNDLAEMKQRGEKISCLTAYDSSFSALIDSIGIDVILVGDSLGMAIQGQKTTLPVTLTDMIYHSRCVSSSAERAFIIADLPFMTYPTPTTAAENAARLVQEGGVHMIKLEGAKTDIIRFISEQGIPVCGHLGLLPQHINRIGRYTVQGKTPIDAKTILADAQSVQQAGASLLILECVPCELAKTISQQLTIPVIGIGAGPDCDGQVLVLYDMLNIGIHKLPRFAKDFLAETGSIKAAILAYHQEVKQSLFPTLSHSFQN